VTAGAVEVQHVTAKHAKRAPAVMPHRAAPQAEKPARDAAEPTPEPKDPDTAKTDQAGKGAATKTGDASRLRQGETQTQQGETQIQQGHQAQGQTAGQPTATTATGDPTRVETKSDTTTLPGPSPNENIQAPSSPTPAAPPSPGTGDVAPPTAVTQPASAPAPGGAPAP
jgi:hypothetical protein